MVSLVWSAALLLLLVVSCVRLQCTDGDLFNTYCTSIQKLNFLLYEHRSAMEMVQCRNNLGPGTLYTWTRSPDGSEDNRMPLNISSNKYTVDGRSLQIAFNNVTEEDGGLYYCDYNGGANGVSRELCVNVYERAVFASCPSEYENGCTNDVQILVMAGQSAQFNATIMYTPGGSCDFQQEITTVYLWKINDGFGVPNKLLFSCGTAAGAMCDIDDPRVSWNRGRDPGLEIVFTLANTIQINDSSRYEVVVRVKHPSTYADVDLTKGFHLQVNPALTVPPTPTIPPTAETYTIGINDVSNINGNDRTAASSGDGGTVATAVVVPLLVVILLVLIVVGFLFLIIRWKQGSWPSSYLYKPPSRVEAVNKAAEPYRAVKTPQADLENMRDSGTADTFRVVAHCTKVQPLDSDPNRVLIRIEDSVMVSLPPENPRMSFIEDMHELPKLILHDKPIPEKPLESPGVPV